MKKLLPFLISLLLLTGFTSGVQGQTVRGVVTSSDDNAPLPGVSIVEKGTTNGTVSDVNGAYSITLRDRNVLVFSFVGYASREIQITTNQTNLDVILSPDITSLNEVIIVGYGSQEKKDVVGSLTAINAGELNRGIVSSPQEMLVGRIAGVQVSTNDGAPGAGSTIRIRGSGSIQGNQDPLIVVDGYPLDAASLGGLSNALASINPNDIESYTVLKDAAATAIYGLRASNGVIIITTKKGRAGKPQINYNGNFSVSSPMGYVDVLNGDEMRSLTSRLVEEGRVPGLNSQAIQRLGESNTDWQREIYRNAFTHDHNVSVAGALENLPYRVSVGRTDQDGILRTTNFTRNSVNVNVSPEFLNGDLQVNLTYKGSQTLHNFGNTGAVGAAVAFDPTQPVYNGSTRWGGFFAWVGPPTATTLDPNGIPIALSTDNPVALLMQTDNRSLVNRSIATAQVDYRLPFLRELKLTANGGFDIATSKGFNNNPINSAFTFENGGGQLVDYTGDNRSRLLDLYANYNREIDKHLIDVTAGHSYQTFRRDGTNFSRNGDSSVYIDYDVDGDGNFIPREFISNPNTLISFFGRLNYTYDEKYMLSVSFRNDASSRFAKENRWVVFPAVGLGWRINRESFLASVEQISELKLRASYGVTGQQEVSGNNPYPYLSTYQISSSTSMYRFGDVYYNTYRPQPYDRDLRWETTAQTDVGLDFGLFKNRITGTVDVYVRKTTDLINSIPIAAGSNFSNFLITNVGSLENRGVEITLNTVPVETQNFRWNAGVNFTRNRNKVTKLLRTDDPNYLGVPTGALGLQRNIQMIQVGQPINSFFVYQQVYRSDGRPVEGLYVDRSGSGGEVTASDYNKYILHSPLPDFLIGVNSQVTYKKWDFYFSGRLSVGNYVYNSVQTGANYSNLYYPTGYFNNLPRAIADTEFSDLQLFSDYYIENASFFKMDNMSLGYNVDKIAGDRLRARFSFTVQNAFFITKYSGIDPEVPTGIDNNLYPRARVFMLGVNLTY